MSLREKEAIEFLRRSGWAGAGIDIIPGDASFRHYARIRHEKGPAILMDAPPDKESVAHFLSVQDYLFNKNYSAPALLAKDEPLGFLLLEDFGDLSFSRVLREQPKREKELYLLAIKALEKMKQDGVKEAACLPLYDHALLMREVMLMAEWMLPEMVSKDALPAAAQSWQEMWGALLKQADLTPEVVVHRDYHADNLFLLGDRFGMRAVGMLDFQDAVLGRAAYDLVSLLEDARRDLTKDVAEAALKHYIKEAKADQDTFLAEYAFFGAQRNAKILGIFTRLFRRDGKPRYLAMMPRVWAHFKNDIAHPSLAPVKSWVEAYLPKDIDSQIAGLHGKYKDAA